jgi:hypothetical protein
MGMRLLTLCALAILAALTAPSFAAAHAERPTDFPNPDNGSVPEYRKGDVNGGRTLVVCKGRGDPQGESKQRIESQIDDATKRTQNLDLFAQCGYDHIQQAVNAASHWDRILVLPGVYTEEPSREASDEPDECKDMTVTAETIPGTGLSLEGEAATPTYEFHRNCPNAQNLIAILGDGEDADRDCNEEPGERQADEKCNLQIEGTGDTRDDVLIQGDKHKLNVIRADRADGIYLKNFTVEFSDFNNIYALETNGFRFDDIESRYSREYGFLSFTSDKGVYEKLDAHHAGDSGVYPGSGPEGHCARYGIEIRNVDSHHNTIGYSGTAGNGVYAHHNRFHDNAAGVTTDSFASGHPGMPQDCAKWEKNQIYSNNNNLFSDDRDRYCQQTPYPKRDPNKVCPTFQVPVGTGLLIAGGNNNIVRGNSIYDNWRNGTRLFYVPPAARGETGASNPYDTSYGNQQVGNRMGLTPEGIADPNGVDFWWDEENGYEEFPTTPGVLNCWEGNSAARGVKLTSDPTTLPGCDGTSAFRPGNPTKISSQATCATWDPETNTDPPGCDWFTLPPEPQPKKPAKR